MNQKKKRILCPIDLEEDNSELLELAAHHAKENDAELVLVHVAQSELPPASGVAVDEFEANISREMKRFETIRPLSGGLQIRHVFRRGVPAPCILETARDMDCALIVIGTHGRTGIRRLLLGSVAEHIIRNAECPVLSFRPNQIKAA